MKQWQWNPHINKIGVLLLPAVLLIMLAAGAGIGLFAGIEDEPYVSEDEDLIVVGMSQLGSESMWRTANTESVQTTFTKQNGYFLIYHNARQRQENQIKAIRSFISQRVDYIVFAPVVEDGWDTVLREAKEAGIPVILMDRKVNVADKSLYVTCIGSDFYEEGRKAGRWLEEELQSRGTPEEEINIVVLKGTEGSSSQLGRTQGFRSIAAAHGSWNILQQEYADFTFAKGKEVMEGLLDKYEDIDVVISQNDDMTLGAIEAIQESGRTAGTDGEITIISFDGAQDALKMVADGIINVDIECNPNQGGYLSDVITMLENGQEVEKQYYVEETVFTKDNVTEDVLRSRGY